MLVGLIRRRLDPWLARADATAPSPHAVEDLVIPGESHAMAARLYRAAPDAGDLLVFFHGGGLVSSSLATHDGACRRLTCGAGLDVLSVDYRLAPEHPYPAAHDDAEAALAFAETLARRRLLAGGDSAGGLLAVAAARRRSAAGRPLDGLALFYPLLALDPVADDPRLFRSSRAWMRRQYTDRPHRETAELAFPDAAGLPPTFIASGGRDPVRLDARRLAGGTVTHHLEPGATHGFLNLAGVSSRARAQSDRAIAALRSAFAP